jgi:hypothetical protein
MNRIFITFALANDQYLTQYWPFCNSNMSDKVSAADMTPKSSLYFTQDKFGNANSALALNGSWTQVPSSVYFNTTTLTISVWIYAQSPGQWSSIVAFGEGAGLNEIQLTQDSGSSDGVPSFCIYIGSTQWGGPKCVKSSQALTQGEWQMLTSTYDGTTMRIYINGVLKGTKIASGTIPKSLIRTYNLIGSAISSSNGYSRSYLDDLRFYNVCLNQSDINYLLRNTRKFEKKCFMLKKIFRI